MKCLRYVKWYPKGHRGHRGIRKGGKCVCRNFVDKDIDMKTVLPCIRYSYTLPNKNSLGKIEENLTRGRKFCPTKMYTNILVQNSGKNLTKLTKFWLGNDNSIRRNMFVRYGKFSDLSRLREFAACRSNLMV